jgi:5-methylcytosine-specific restriction endonuclease McrA
MLRRLPLRRRKPLRAVSDRKLQTNEDYRDARMAVAARSRGRCETHLEGVCSHEAGEVHHVLPRSRGGNDHTLERLRHICSPCHHWVHDNPHAARALGLLI